MTKHHSNAPLEVLASDVLSDLRQSFSEVIGAIGEPIGNARELANLLGLEQTLGWKIWRVSHGDGRYPSTKHIPGRPSVDTFLIAVGKQNVPSDLIEVALIAYERYERLIREHANDRALFDSMLSRIASDGIDQSQERAIRRNGFRATSHAFGIHAKTAYEIKLVFPGDHDLLDLAAIRGHFGIQRVRSDSPWLVRRSRFSEDDSEIAPHNSGYRYRSLGSQQSGGLPMPIREFCSDPLPEVEWINIDTVNYDCILKPGPVGKSCAINWVTGEHIMGVPRDTERLNAVSLNIYTPCECACMDFFIHKSLWDGTTPEFRAFCGLFGTINTLTNPYTIPVYETVIDLGSADRLTALPMVPRYRDLIRFAFDEVQQDLKAFRLFRVQMQYPPVPIILALLHSIRALDG